MTRRNRTELSEIDSKQEKVRERCNKFSINTNKYVICYSEPTGAGDSFG